MKKLKGFSIAALLVVLAAVAVVGTVIYFVGKGGLGFGGGKGDGEGSGNAETAEQAMATVQESEMTTEITTQEIVYIEVKVHENFYLYNTDQYEISDIEQLIGNINESEEKFSVRVIDENASERAYSQLLSAFDENKIKYIELAE